MVLGVALLYAYRSQAPRAGRSRNNSSRRQQAAPLRSVDALLEQFPGLDRRVGCADPRPGPWRALHHTRRMTANAPRALMDPEWGSDVAAQMLRRLGIKYAALNPGASFRGLHDSIVNHLGNERPQLVMANHEEIAVAIAHGYAKVAGQAMAAIVHSNVGLMHATMSIFNAWVDRVPVLVLGATGPLDSAKRRPWIDWIHTSNGQGELVRDYTKWESQPGSVEAMPEALLRAWQAAHLAPQGPVYVCLDQALQEERLGPGREVKLLDPAGYPFPSPPQPAVEDIDAAALRLAGAAYPVILAGRVGRGAHADLVALAEALGAAVLSDLKSPSAFPASHELSQAEPALQLTPEVAEVLRRADVVLALERIDPMGTLRGAGVLERDRPPALINVSLEPFALRSWSADHQELPAAALAILADAEAAVTRLRTAVDRVLRDRPEDRRRAEDRLAAHRARKRDLEAAREGTRRAGWDDAPVSLWRLAGELHSALGELRERTIVARLPLGWPGGAWELLGPGSYLGGDGGGGIGSGPGMTVGAALAARDLGRVAVGILGDGDVAMSPMALWTAAHERLPALIVVANNQSYFNDEQHQGRVARTRGRPAENKWVGQRLTEPAMDFAQIAHGFGVEAFGPITTPAELAPALHGAVAALADGRPALVDVRVLG